MSELPPAPVDRRFYAFVVDRLAAWGLYAAAGAAAYLLLDDVWTTVAVVAGVVAAVGLASALALGLRGTSLGKAALGLRLVDPATGRPVGVPAALLRTLLLGAAALPTLGLATAALAWTALADRSGRRRGVHDLLAHGLVVDERPPPVEEVEAEAATQQVVNLTAMRLMPAPSMPMMPATPATPVAATPPSIPATPVAASPPSVPATPRAPVPAPAGPPGPPPGEPPAAPGKRQRLGWPLLPAPTSPPPPPPSGAPGAHAAPPGTASPASRPGGHRTRGGRRRAETTAEREAGQRPNAATRWRVSFDTGESLVVEGLTLVGRRPEPRPGEPVRHLMPLRSQDMSLSKTHAQLQVADDGVLVVLDRGSTNGTFLVRQGAARPLPAGRGTSLADGDRVRFGDREMSVSREG
ncbi:RDD family protein [Nocardioides ferulae]|uniref:RDD family protein n=1 Tax=Nocardioides ferulae TaxID=2340821 RepID=UPI000EB3E097|nr:RDD family protein [Nocardioides ferulae]